MWHCFCLPCNKIVVLINFKKWKETLKLYEKFRKYICVFDKYRKENKYQHFKIEENHNTILKMQGALETQRKLRTSQIDLEQLYNILQELSEGFSIQEVAKILIETFEA
ncbi:hypothetical protein [Mycoplasmopsis bovirhinis]|uniref:Uncharacterized protein n=1 Tax=Mycoplasmopsis bovirhinis TaxID=29553 RepID=A0A449AE29_9BACT|nr:hypothetical protein [Mycoplasmopsis bovirhinis]VEU63216.1 Uncharacterised protein [Mycoplasmopsis bovirhinis]VEU64257.1 Uncharacterised protein [Mycoplasmopsis bovirhinis]